MTEREQIFELLKRPPPAERIASMQQARAFKAVAEAAKKAALAGKANPARIKSTLNELRSYYQ